MSSFEENEQNVHLQEEEEEEDEEYTPEELLLDSSRYGEDDVLQQVLEAGVDLSVQDENGNTALHLAAANGHIRCLELLRDAGAPFMLNDAGNSPLHWAVHLKREESVQFLLQHFDTDVLAQNSFGMSALSEGFGNDSIPILQSLLEHDSAAEEKIVSAMDVREEDLEPIEILLDPSLEPISIMQQPITAEEGDILGNQEASKDETGLVVWSAAVVLARFLRQDEQMAALFDGEKRVCELGAGCGFLSKALRVLFPQASVTATDISEKALDNLRLNLEASGAVVQALDWAQPELPEELASQDVVIASDVVYRDDLEGEAGEESKGAEEHPVLRVAHRLLAGTEAGVLVLSGKVGDRLGFSEELFRASGLFSVERFEEVRAESHPGLFGKVLEDEEMSSVMFNDLEGEAYAVVVLRKREA